MFYEDKAVIENNETESGSIYDTVVSPFFCICSLRDCRFCINMEIVYILTKDRK